MKRFPYYIFFFVSVFCCIAQHGYCGWNKVGQFRNEVAGCGFFWDESDGLVGFGSNRGGMTTARIRKTIDGGKTWTVCTTPNVKGAVTHIFMKDRLVGYASIYETSFFLTTSIWKTTDGGSTWFDNSFGDAERTNCVYATSKALIRTIWFSNSLGGVSLDDGVTFSAIFANGNGDRSNGIDFCDDFTGVVTMGPPNSGTQSPAWNTQDGGLTWNQGDPIPESWSVYGVKGTKTFLTMSEDNQNFPGQTVFWSQNGGVNWASRFVFPNSPSFTGHIAGGGSTVYVQTDTNSDRGNQGLFRSDDLGQSWLRVGGPSSQRDTRFVVTGCKGEVVYAFDILGNIWKTTDGGDGTLIVSPNGSLLTFLQDSLYLETRYCQPITWTINLLNPSCGVVTLDGVTITPNPYGEFSIGTSTNGIVMPPTGPSFGVPITFRSDSNVTRHTMVHIQAHEGNKTIDTTIILVAKHSTAPEPYLVTLNKTKVGDTAVIPVFIHPTSDSFAIKHITFHLSYDGDILTPAFQRYRTIGSLSSISTVTIGPSEPSGILVTIDLPEPITQDSDLTKPLIFLRMGVTLSRYMSCPVRLDTFAISNTAPLPLCSIPITEFVVDPQCGDSSISSYMFDGTVPKLFSVHPNPNSGKEVEAVISLPRQSLLTIEFVDVMGKTVLNVCAAKQFRDGEHTLRIITSSLANGSYLLRMRSSEGNVSTQEVVILR